LSSNIQVKFSKILVPVDGSESSMKAADYGLALAKNGGSSEVIVLHVIHSQIKYLYSSTVATLVTSNTIDTIIDRAKQEAQKWLTKVEGNANKNAVKLKTEFVVYEWLDTPGHPGSEKKTFMAREKDCIFCMACENVCPPQCIKIFQKGT
jgi:nucleotide-binding universal stress UspA family protein